jgi:catechol 2,3-dioxygenase-like lactoylglutathione lyase family enzyme
MPALGRIILYVKDVEQSASFYVAHFGFEVRREEGDRIVELLHRHGGANLLLHPTARSQKSGQSTIKLVFNADDMERFVARSKPKFGTIPQGQWLQLCQRQGHRRQFGAGIGAGDAAWVTHMCFKRASDQECGRSSEGAT